MHVHFITPILNVSDVPASIEWFVRLGWRCLMSYNRGGVMANAASHDANGPAHFARIGSGEGELFLCHNAQGLRGGKPARFDGDDDTGAMWMSLWLESPAHVDAAHAEAVAAGVTILWPPTDEPWGVRECRIMHPDGHVFRLSAGLAE